MRRFYQDFFNLPVGFKLILGYSIAFILSLAVGGIVIDSLVRRTVEANIQRDLSNSTTAILNMVRNTADVAIRNYLRAVAEKNLQIAAGFYAHFAQGFISQQEAQEQARVALVSQTIGQTGFIYAIDNRGVIRVHPDEEMVGRNISPYPFVETQKKQKSGYLEYDWQNPGEEHARPRALYMSYFVPWDWIISVSTYRGEFEQLINVQDLRRHIAEMRFGETGFSFIFDAAGVLLTYPRSPGGRYPVYELVGPEVMARMVREKQGTITFRWPDPGRKAPREKLVIFNHLPEFDWIVASLGYPDEFFKPLDQVRSIIVATIGFSLLLVFPISFFLSSLITRPVRRLKARFAAGATGDFSVRMGEESRDEIGDLARYFNSFMERLQEYDRSLKHEIEEHRKAEEETRLLNEELERRVAERTARLEETLEMVRQTQSQLIQAEKMAALGSMVSWVAHEINTPVGIGVTAGTHMEEKTKQMERLYRENRIKRSDMESFLDSALQSASIILANLRRAADLIRSLKQVAVDQASEERRTFNLRDYIREILNSLQPKLRQTAHHITVDCPGDLSLDSYPGAFSQIFTNLIMNSLTHAFTDQEPGEIRIAVRREEDTLRIEFSDNGRGIEPEVLPRIFEPFFTTRRGQGGSGLGLHIVYNLVNLTLGGSIFADSQPGQGTTFVMRIPYYPG
jgi:signal transduction histidine kinase